MIDTASSPPMDGSHRELRPLRHVVLPCLLLLGSMFNLTLVVAGLKEFILDDLGGTVGDLTLFFSVETIAYILFAPLWGLLSDRVGARRRFIVLGFFVSAMVYLSYGFVEDVTWLLGLRFLQGAFTVMGWSLVMATVLDRVSGPRSGRYLGLMGAALIFGVAAGAPVGGYLTGWGGPRMPVLIAAGSFFLLSLGSFLLAPSGTAPSTHRVGRVRSGPGLEEILGSLLARPRLLFPFLFHFVDRFAVGLFLVIFPLYLDSLGASDPAHRGRFLLYFLGPFAVLQLLTGWLAERTGPVPPLILGSVLFGLALARVGSASLAEMPLIMMVLGVLAALMFPPSIILTSRWSHEQMRASAMGGFNLAGSLGFALGPLFGSWAYGSRGFAFAFVACGTLEVIMAVAAAGPLWLLRRRGVDA